MITEDQSKRIEENLLKMFNKKNIEELEFNNTIISSGWYFVSVIDGSEISLRDFLIKRNRDKKLNSIL